MKVKTLYLLNVFLTFVLLASLLANASFNRSVTTATLEYDPWIDINDDGVIDGQDAVMVIDRIPSTGTPINKTALLLELQNKVESLETRVPKRSFVSIPPAAFVPLGKTQDWENQGVYLKGEGPFHAPLYLPQGVKIMNFSVWVLDTYAFGDIEVRLVEWNQTARYWNDFAMLASGDAATPGVIVLYNDTIVHSGIDNKNCIYVIDVFFHGLYGDSLILFDVFIEFEYKM